MSEHESTPGKPKKAYYRPEDVSFLHYDSQLNDPGSYPFTRGRSPEVGATPWFPRELSGEGDPAHTNRQLKYLLEKGQVSIDVIGDTPTMAMIDPDHPFAANAVGTQGVSLCCLQDFRDLYRDIPLESVPVAGSLPPAFALAGLYILAQENNISPGVLRGSVVQAPFYCDDCGYAVHMPFPLRLRMVSDSIEFCCREMPKFHSFLEDTYFIREAGLTAVEEMALGFVEIRYVVKELLKRGIDIDLFAPRIAILVNCGMDFFEEIAKIRATRKMFARMMKEEFGARDPRSWKVVIASHTSGLSLTAQQPFNNIVRGTLQALSLVLGGVQAIEISAFDEAYRTPSPESHLIGLRTQQVIQLESNASQVLDPLGGSYFMEHLTSEMEENIKQLMSRIESLDDPARLVESGWFKKMFNNAAERYARSLKDSTLLKVGLNVLQLPDKEDRILKDIAESKIEPCRERVKKIKDFKSKRDPDSLKTYLNLVYTKAMQQEENLMYPFIEALKAGATMGEIAGVLRKAYGGSYDPFGMVEPPVDLEGG